MGGCGVFVDCCSAEQTQKVADSSAMDTCTVSNLVSSAAHMAGDATGCQVSEGAGAA